MKRSALILLTAVYLLSLVGIGINRFYCCGKLASVTMTIASADHTEKDNCCKHESKNFKVKDSHVVGNTTLISQVIPVILPEPMYQIAVDFISEQAVHTGYLANAPPDNPAVPIYTINCAYRI